MSKDMSMSSMSMVFRKALAVLFMAVCLSAQAEVELPKGVFYKNIDDLTVKVLGGKITIRRTWYKGEWYSNRAWVPLDIPGGETLVNWITKINRNDDKYQLHWHITEPAMHNYNNCGAGGNIMPDPDYVALCKESALSRVNGVGVVYSLDGIEGAPAYVDKIVRTETGYRWFDLKGDWIDYDPTGVVQSYGDNNGAIAQFDYDADGKRSGIKDRLNNQVIWYEYDVDGHLRYVRDADNNQVEYRYTNGQLAEVIDVRGYSWKYTYTDGLLSSIADPENRVTDVTYDNTGKVAKIVKRDAEANAIETRYRFDYDKNRKEFYSQVKGPTGSVAESWYTRGSVLKRKAINGHTTYSMSNDTSDKPNSRSSKIYTDRRGLETQKEYDQWNHPIKTTYPDGSFTTAKYLPGTNRVLEKTDELGRLTSYEYDDNMNLIRLTEAKGLPEERITEYRYNADGLRIEKKILADAESEEALTTYDYDPQGNLKTLTDPENNVTEFTHNIRGDVLTRTDPNDKLWKYTYDPAGNLLTRTDPLDHTVTLTYDKVGNLVSSKDARNHTTTYAYDLQDKRISQTDPLTHKTELGYDGAGRLTSIKDPLGNVQTLGYDLQGRMISQKDPAGNETALGYGEDAGQGGGLDGATNYPGLLNRTQYPTYLQTYDYDKRDRRTRTIDHLDAGAAVTVTKYDLVGNKIETTDAENRVTKYRYDALNRLIEIIDPLNQSTGFSYDNRDNLLTVTDPNNHTTRYTYDKADRKTSEIRPGGQTITYTYDPAGNLLTTTDPDGRKTVNTYDDAGQLHQQEHFLPGETAPERTVVYSYDNNGNLTGYGDGSLSATYVYDENNRKTQESTDYGTFSLGHSYTYDAAGNKKSFTGPDDVTVTYHWDKGLLSRIEIPGEGSIYYNSYKWSRPDKITWPGGSTRQISYDADLKPKRILDLDPGENPTLDYQYTYDKTGNIEQKATQNQTYDYAYDLLQRLTEAKSEGETEGWEYDPNGNRTSDNLNPGTWEYDENDRLKQSPSITYTYDEAGNTTSKTEGGVTTTYLYNAEGRLNRIEDATQALIGEYRYDPMGRRIKKTTQSETLYFDYSDEGLVGEYDANGNVVRQYGYAPESIWTTDPLYQKTEQGYVYYRNDHLGTPQQLAAKNGAKVWKGEYLAFGEVKAQTGAWGNRLRFAGQYYDEETGNYYNYFRDYDPATGRYIQEDPYGLGGGINVYEYAGSNPNTLYDPTGEILPAVVYGAFWLECFDKCISRTSAIGTFCDAVGVDKYSVCAAKCTIQGFNPLKKITKVFRFAFRIGGKSGVAGKAARKAARKRQRQSRRRNRRK